MNELLCRFIVYPTIVALRGEWPYGILRSLERSQFWPSDDLQDLQLKRLNRILAHARSSVAFYRDRMPDRVTSFDDLKTIPLLEKDDVRQHFSQLLSSGAKAGRQCEKTTGGSTGAPVTIRKDSMGIANELAAMWRGYRWAGVEIGSKQARFWGVPQTQAQRARARLIDCVTNRKRLSAFAFQRKQLEDFVKVLSRFKPHYFYGYVSILRQFADFVKETALAESIRPRSIITTSEVLSQIDREFISDVFMCKVFNEYGCGEVGTIAHECEKGSLHINAENVIVEILGADGQAVRPGVPGEVVVTDLSNYSMPLIRYRLGDWASWAAEECSCGRALPQMEGIHGRAYDILRNSKGQSFHGEFFLYMFEDAKKAGLPVRAFQVVQKGDGVLIVKLACEDAAFGRLTELIGERIRGQFDDQVRLSFAQVPEIEREKSGKVRLVKREVASVS